MLVWQKIRTVMLATVIAAGAVAVVPAGAQALECGEGSLRGAGAVVDNIADCNVLEADDGNDLPALVETLVGILLALIGIIAVAVIIYGAVQMILSEGDPSKVKTGKSAIIAGVTGLIIALMAWAIISFVTSSISVEGDGGGTAKGIEDEGKEA